MAHLVLPVLEALGLALIVAVSYCLVLVIRRRGIARNGGTFELSYRARPDKVGRGWVLGIGRYCGDHLEWFRIFTLSPQPKKVWDRQDLEILGRRAAQGTEHEALYSDHVIITCSTPAGPLELAMSQQSLMGFQAWLEAMTPGSRGVRPGDAPAAI